MSYKNYNWTVIAHDSNSPYLRDPILIKSFTIYKEKLDLPNPAVGLTSKNYQLEYMVDLDTWVKTHEVVKERVIQNPNYFEELIDKSVTWGEHLNSWTEENVYKADLKKLSGKELISLVRTFADKQSDEYVYGTVLPVLDFHDFSFVEGNLKKTLEKLAPSEKFSEYYSLFTEPINSSFSEDQEKDLLRLVSRYFNDSAWKNDVRDKSFDEIKSKYPKFAEDLSNHTEKHGWVYYAYMGPAFKEENFLDFIKQYIEKNVDPERKLNEIEQRKVIQREQKERIIKELKPDQFEEFILRVAGKVVWAKPRRKDYQSKSYFHMEKLMREIAHRLSVSLNMSRTAPIEFLEKGLEVENLDWRVVDEIKRFHVCVPNENGTVTTLVGQEALEFSKNNIKRAVVDDSIRDIKELKGSTACRGKVQGKVKVINLPEEMKKMEDGDILVSAATTPSIVPAMKKAGAIATDEGGLTCHAAIVSRELGTPCVVGLKIATQVFKDGDMVEVDADKGIVKKI